MFSGKGDKKMTKKELMQEVAKKTKYSQKEAEEIIEAVFESIAEELAIGGKVQFVGFGTFETRKRASRVGRNPHTGEVLTIKEAIVPTFKPGKTLKVRVDKK